MSPSVSPTGDVSLSGNLHYRTVQDQLLVRNVTIDGKAESKTLTAVASGKRVEVRQLEGSYRLGDGTLQLTNFSVETLGGRMTAVAEMIAERTRLAPTIPRGSYARRQVASAQSDLGK